MTDSLLWTLEWTSRLTGLALVFQAIEGLRLGPFQPLPPQAFRFAGYSFVFYLVAGAHLVLASSLLFTPSFWVMTTLCATHYWIAVKNHGLFNGASDSMTFILLICQAISLWEVNHSSSFAGVGIYLIGTFSLISYFVAGIAKVIQKGWRDGSSLKIYFELEAYGAPSVLRDLSPFWIRVLAWSVMAFELLLPLGLLNSVLLGGLLLIALVFHLGNFWAFGLNRFFWTWLATYPSIWHLHKILSPS